MDTKSENGICHAPLSVQRAEHTAEAFSEYNVKKEMEEQLTR